jgi:hypothetical protein
MDETKVSFNETGAMVAIKAALRRDGRVVILLPDNFHHALWLRLETGPVNSPELDVEGTSGLLQQVASIRGLGGLRHLLPCLEPQARMTSPAPMIDIDIRDERTAADRSGEDATRR